MDDDDARAIVRATLSEMGIDISDPAKMQRDFVYLRSQRVAAERIGVGARMALIGTLISGGLALLWMGIKAAFHQP